MTKALLPDSGRVVFDRLMRGLLAGSFVRVINYHNTPQRRFEEYDRQLARYAETFGPADEQDIEDYLRTGEWRRGKPGLIPVFFEGYLNNYEVGAALAEKHGFIAWFLIPSAFPGQPVERQREFAKAHHIGLIEDDGRRVAMNWDEVRDLEARGHVIASHTRTHSALNLASSEEELRDEIVRSQYDFEEQLGHPVKTFAWLYGSEYGGDPRADRLVHEAGYRLLFSNFQIQKVPDEY